MAARKKATKNEREIINRLANAIVIQEIAKGCIDKEFTQGLDETFLAFSKQRFPECFRLLDELEKAIPRTYRAMSKRVFGITCGNKRL